MPDKRKRYIESYDTKNRVLDRLRLFRINMKQLPWWKRIDEAERMELKRLKNLKAAAEKATHPSTRKNRRNRPQRNKKD